MAVLFLDGAYIGLLALNPNEPETFCSLSQGGIMGPGSSSCPTNAAALSQRAPGLLGFGLGMLVAVAIIIVVGRLMRRHGRVQLGVAIFDSAFLLAMTAGIIASRFVLIGLAQYAIPMAGLGVGTIVCLLVRSSREYRRELKATRS